MNKRNYNNPIMKRLGALALTLVMLLSMLPTTVFAAAADSDLITTVTDPQTLTRPSDIYGNDTQNAGKVTVGKSVSAGSVTVPLTSSTNQTLTASDPNNFMVTVSQAAQVVGVTGETSVPVDVVFVLDTSRSMQGTDVQNLVTAANSAIATLMAANENNRVAVVAFSGDSGQGTSNGAHANVLSELAHYDDATEAGAASNHIRWVTSTGSATGSNRNYIQGRGVNAGRRLGTSTGTNIHAGVALGGSLLANVPKAETVVDGVTRLPVMVIMSDGAPTNASGSTNNENWYNPSLTTELSTTTNERDGKGFLAVMTAAYYKGLITEKYFGSSGSENNRCYIYTMGLGLSSGGLAEMTMDPSGADRTNSYYEDFQNYWNQYAAGRSFNVKVESNLNYPMTAESIAATQKYVNGTGLGYSGGMNYNDGYFSASQSSQLNAVFQNIVTEISKKAMSVPTMVTTTDDFSGYVTFTDVLGEYMELKNMVGVVANGTVYQGAGFARRMSAYGDSSDPDNDPRFDALLREVMQTRLNMSDSMKGDAEYVENNLEYALASENQAYWNSNSDYDNSLVWWGVTYNTGEEDTNIQNLGYADDDSIEYIEAQKAAGTIPVGADSVVRSYFFYGTAGDQMENPHSEYLYFVVRVSRSLQAPYQQTVTISAPASLLSMERVLIHEESDGTYTAEVESALPTRVVYEVGLRSDINPYTVKSIVADNYKNETVNGTGSVNYNAATDSYSFFTNDWDRTQAQGSHHRAMTKATFDAAADNAFYRYQENETLYVKNGNTYTKYTGATLPNGVYYYAREGYSWSGTATNGKYKAQAETFYIRVDIEDDNKGSIVRNTADNTWYIPAGLYTASTLEVNGDDVLKDNPSTAAANDGNLTNTAVVVAHPHRTGDVNNSHYTVLLGNNGMLTMQAKDAKEVSIDRGGAGTTIINDADGKAVMVGDVLTYTIEATNTTGAAANIVITDRVPVGTEFVSAANNGTHSSGALSWTVKNVAAGASAKVSFKVRVTEAALNSAVVNIENQATVKVGNNPSYTTNTVTNPPEGKKVSVDGGLANGDVQVGSELTYEILYANDTDTVQTVTITDTIPDGTAYEEGTASPTATFSGNKLTWTLNNVQPGVTGTVSFRVKVTAAALNNSDNNIENHATIKIGNNDPEITNTTFTKRQTGSIKLLKTVVDGDANKEFTMILTEATGTLEGTFQMTGANGSTVVFNDGKATITGVKHNAEVTISGLPLNTHIAVNEEHPGNGWTPAYTKQTGYVKGSAPYDVLMVTNTYAAEPVWFNLQGIKHFVGAGYPAGEAVSLQARACDADGNLIAVGQPGYRLNTATAINSAVGAQDVAFSFSARSFTTTGTYYYLISEQIASGNKLPNVEYATNQYLMKLEITDVDGKLKATTTMKTRANSSAAWSAESAFDWQNEKVEFTNTHYSSTTVRLSGNKQMTGQPLSDNMFSFELINASGHVISTAYLVADTTDSMKGSFTFAPIVYDLDDLGGANSATFTYYLREVNGGLGGVNYDAKVYTVTVTVVKNADGTLTATPTYTLGGTPATIVFTNAYTVDTTSAKYTPVASKTLTGRDLVAGEFRFEVIALEGSGSTYTMVTETVGTLTVPKVVSTGANAAANENVSAEVTFTPIGFTDHTTPGTPKTYYYLLREVTGTESTVTYDTTVYVLGITVQDYSGTLKVDQVVYYNATVSGSTITLGAAISGAEVNRGTADEIGQIAKEKIPFTNHYGSGYAMLNPVLTKYFADVTGTHVLKSLSGSEFDFEITDEATSAVVSRGTNRESSSVGGAQIDFESIIYTSTNMGTVKGTPNTKNYSYTIKEIEPANAGDVGIAYDSKTITMTVAVTDNGYGDITVGTPVFTDSDSITGNEQSFTNKYNPAGAGIMIPVDKQLVGKTLDGEQFTFVLEKWDGAQWQVVGTAQNANTGNEADFALAYTAADLEGIQRDAQGIMRKDLVYRVTEKSGEITGGKTGTYSYSAEEYRIKVALIDNGSGKMSADVKYEKKAADGSYVASAPPVFTNTYTPDPVTLDVDAILGAGKITKTVVYPDGTPVANYDLTKFTFSLVDTMGNKLSTGITSADGKITFDPVLTFTEARDYHYWIVEDESSATGITNDRTRWEVHVEVGYDAVEGKLFVAEENIYPVSRAAEAVAEIEFVNTYEPAATAVVITADKTLTGRQLNNGEFYFQLVEQMEVGGKKMEMLRSEAANRTPDQNGKALVAFRVNYTYADIGQHSYLLREVNDGKGGVTYDSRTSKITVTVKDENGQLKAYVGNATASAAVVDSGVDFANTYQAEPVGVQLLAEKKLDGRELKDGEFSFKVFDSTGAQVSAGKNRADGIIVFDTITFEQVGKYTLRVAEINTGDAEITYDEKIYTVYVEVTDNGVGQLTAKVTSEEENITFYNVWAKPEESPKTGDSFNAPLVLSAMICSAAAAVVLVSRKKKEETAE